MLKIIFVSMLILAYPFVVFADGQSGFGGVASNIMGPVMVLSDFVGTGCLLVGVGFIFASIIKYVEHRRSPLMVSISTVIFLFVAGVVLVILPFLPMFTGTGLPYTLAK